MTGNLCCRSERAGLPGLFNTFTEPGRRVLARYLRHGRPSVAQKRVFLCHHFPWGTPLRVGQVRYAVQRAYIRAHQGRALACVLFGAAAWQCADRDRAIGWEAPARSQRLHLLTNNTRFLIPAWVRVRHLAS